MKTFLVIWTGGFSPSETKSNFFRLRYWITLQVFLFLFLLVGVNAVPTPAQQPDSYFNDNNVENFPSIPLDEAVYACGRRSLFLLLRLSGIEVTYEKLVNVVPVGERGTSLSELEECARLFLDNPVLVKAGPESLGKITLPAIAHIWHDSQAATAGHYIVLLDVNSDSIVYADGSAGKIDTIARSQFERSWSGYLLVTNDPLPINATTVTIAMLTTVALTYLFLRGISNSALAKSYMYMLALPLAITVGCGESSNQFPSTNMGGQNEPVLKHASDLNPQAILRTSPRIRDLGVVTLGESARALFSVSNVGNAPADLSLGKPSCGCLTTSLSMDHLDPGESAEIELVLQSGNVYSGPQEGAVILGSPKSDLIYVFKARAIVEGMRSLPYTVRLPQRMDELVLEPIRGEIVCGPSRSEPTIKIVEAVLFEGGSGVLLGGPILSPLEDLGQYQRRRFEIPIHLADGETRLPTGSYSVRITYRIDEDFADHPLKIRIIPLAEFP